MSGKKLNPLLRLLLSFGPRVKARKLVLCTSPPARVVPFPLSRIVTAAYSFSSGIVSTDCSFSRIRVKSALELSTEIQARDYPIPAPQASALPGLDFRHEYSDVFSVSLSPGTGLRARELSWTWPQPDQHRSIPCSFRTGYLSLKPVLKPVVRNETSRMESLSLARKALFLEIFPTEYQLDFWRRAVVRTRLEPREFTLLGVFGGIPAAEVNLRYDTAENRLHFVPGEKKSFWKKYKEVAVFRKNSDQSLLVVSAGD